MSRAALLITEILKISSQTSVARNGGILMDAYPHCAWNILEKEKTGLQLLIPEAGLEMEWGVKNLAPEGCTE